MKYFYKDEDGKTFVKDGYRCPNFSKDLDLLKIKDFGSLFAELNSDELGIKEMYWHFQPLFLTCYISSEDPIFLMNILELGIEQIQVLFEELLKGQKINNASMSTLCAIMSLYNKFPDDLKLLIETKL